MGEEGGERGGERRRDEERRGGERREERGVRREEESCGHCERRRPARTGAYAWRCVAAEICWVLWSAGQRDGKDCAVSGAPAFTAHGGEFKRMVAALQVEGAVERMNSVEVLLPASTACRPAGCKLACCACFAAAAPLRAVPCDPAHGHAHGCPEVGEQRRPDPRGARRPAHGRRRAGDGGQQRHRAPALPRHGESWPTAALPIDNLYCSCKLTRCG